MKGRLWWSSVLPLAATLCLPFAAQVAKADSATTITVVSSQGVVSVDRAASRKRPGLINPQCGLVGGPAVASADCDSQSGREWE